jgi:hypothetical protein
MSNRVIYPDQNDPRRSHIHALNEVDIKAAPEAIWKLLIDAEDYSSFYPHAKEVKIVTGKEIRQ